MANFPTHLGIGTLASGMLATLTLAANVVGPESLIAVTVAGVVGSVLPDIDLEDSRPGRALFFGFAAFFSFVALYAGAGRFSIVELWLLAGATFLFVRYVAHGIFHRLSYHRGIFHSIVAAAFFGLLTVLLYKHVFGRHEGVAWLAGGFLFIGYLVHLLLDEIYSVDVMDTRVKASFGTALKFWDGRHLGQSGLMAAATVGLFLIAPPSKPFVDGLTSPQLWAGLKHQLLPRDKWFGVVDPAQIVRHVRGVAAETEALPQSKSATGAGSAADIATGAIQTGDGKSTAPAK